LRFNAWGTVAGVDALVAEPWPAGRRGVGQRPAAVMGLGRRAQPWGLCTTAPPGAHAVVA